MWNSTTCDFAALDADGKSTNGIWERNYTHHNDGPAFVFGDSPAASPWGPNQFRLNISEEDDLQNTDGGGVWALSPTNGGYVYNNTAYRSLNQNGSVSYRLAIQAPTVRVFLLTIRARTKSSSGDTPERSPALIVIVSHLQQS
jgi:hypothetical protein